jgi:hypothetical protein
VAVRCRPICAWNPGARIRVDGQVRHEPARRAAGRPHQWIAAPRLSGSHRRTQTRLLRGYHCRSRQPAQGHRRSALCRVHDERRQSGAAHGGPRLARTLTLSRASSVPSGAAQRTWQIWQTERLASVAMSALILNATLFGILPTLCKLEFMAMIERMVALT